jgi:hypothetical protein
MTLVSYQDQIVAVAGADRCYLAPTIDELPDGDPPRRLRSRHTAARCCRRCSTRPSRQHEEQLFAAGRVRVGAVDRSPDLGRRVRARTCGRAIHRCGKIDATTRSGATARMRALGERQRRNL